MAGAILAGKRLTKKQRQFDVVLLDPPTFSKSKEPGIFRAEDDDGRLVTDALKVLKRVLSKPRLLWRHGKRRPPGRDRDNMRRRVGIHRSTERMPNICPGLSRLKNTTPESCKPSSKSSRKFSRRVPLGPFNSRKTKHPVPLRKFSEVS
jgi:hypothetical protein